MKNRKIFAIILIIVAFVFGVKFFLEVEFPIGLEAYFKREYYGQFGPLAICIELLIAGIYLFVKHSKTNFTLALFGFTAILDPIFNLIGLFSSMVPLYATIIFVCCALLSLWLAFTDTFKLGRISFIGALISFILSNAVELFFNLN
jgi:hypothetical protein